MLIYGLNAMERGSSARVQGDVALQHRGEAALLVVAGRPEVHGARDVGGAAVVLGAAVQQQHGAGVRRRAGVFRGPVVDDGAVAVDACGECQALSRCLCRLAVSRRRHVMTRDTAALLSGVRSDLRSERSCEPQRFPCYRQQ